MNFRFLTPALSELSDAMEYYNSQVFGLGSEFIEDVESTIARILNHPKAWSKISSRFRHCNLRRFPYSIIYTQINRTEILIVSVFHQNREPESWQKNIKHNTW